MLEDLARALAPALTPAPESPSGSGDAMSNGKPCSDLARILGGTGDRLDRLADVVVDLRHRLEL